MRITQLLVPLALCIPAVFIACSEDKPNPIVDNNTDGGPGTGDGGGDGGGGNVPDSPLGKAAPACTDSVDSIYGDPGALAGEKGDIVKCVKEKILTKAEMQAAIAQEGVTLKPLTSDALVYRITYRTTRGDTAGSAAVSSAIVYIPNTPRADKLPIVVAARGSRGQAAKCAVSKFDPSLEGINQDAYRLVYQLVGAGYAVIYPDLAGYVNFGATGNPASAYAQAADVARSTLDGSRALKKMFPTLDDKVVIVGHSQGGHSALSSLAAAESYGSAAPIVGVATYAPLWLPQRSWGALLFGVVGNNFPIAASSAPAVSVWYHYTQAELLDGPGEGKKLFKAEKQDAIVNFVQNECWGSKALESQGTYTADLFDSTFASDVGFVATQGGTCANDRCTKWMARYAADRPKLTGAAATTPILLAYGMQDTTIPKERMKCALDRLKSDNTTKLSVCVEPDATHGGIVGVRGEYVSEWIASVALGGAAPAACAQTETAFDSITCATPPPND